MIKSKDFYSNINVDDKYIDEVIEKGKLVNINKSGTVPFILGKGSDYGLYVEYCKYEYKNKIYYIVFQCYGNHEEGVRSRYCRHFSEYNNEYDIMSDIKFEKSKEIYLIDDCYKENDFVYFTKEDDAIKYACYKNYKDNCTGDRYFVRQVKCLDNTEDLSNVTLKYSCVLTYKFCNGLKLDHISTPIPYVDDYLRSNKIWHLLNSNKLEVHVNMYTNSKDDAESIGNAIIDELCKFTKSAINFIGFVRFSNKTVVEFNEYLRREETERKRREEEERIKQQELAELARLKAKYEQQ